MPGITNQNLAPQIANQQLSYNQIAALAYKAGFRGQGLTNIVAISQAESSGNVSAGYSGYLSGTHNSIGLTQINANAHPQYTPSQLLDPLANMQAAYQISNGGKNFTPWTTYINGSYKRYLSPASQAASVISSAPSMVSQILNALGNSGFGLAGIATSVLTPKSLTNPITSGILGVLNIIPWIGILEIIGGSIVVLAGVYLLVNSGTKEDLKGMVIA